MPKVFSKIGRTEESVNAEKFINYVKANGCVPYQEAYQFVHLHFPNARDFEGIVSGAIKAGHITIDLTDIQKPLVKAVV